MNRPTFSAPISIIIIALFVISMALMSAYASTIAMPYQQVDDSLTDTADEMTSQAFDTQDALTVEAILAANSTSTSTPTATNDPSSVVLTPTATNTVSPTDTPTLPLPTDTLLRPTTTAIPTPIPPVQPVLPTATPLVDLPTEVASVLPEDTLVCIPGEPIIITGNGPPNTPFLLYFDQRVVSGGSVRSNGTFSVGLVVGNERGGTYPVMVRVRGSSDVLRQLTCAVPNVTPTPVPRVSNQP